MNRPLPRLLLGFTAPIRVVSEANLREHWSKRARRAKAQRAAACLACRASGGKSIAPPCHIVLTRIAPRDLDTDNLARAFKAVRDGIADALGVDDGDARIEWSYRQERGAPKEYAVMMQVWG
jgi:crossover junction endodeoxyribonuclease RusA